MKLGAIHSEPPASVRPLSMVASLHLMSVPKRADWWAAMPADGDALGNLDYGNCVEACDLNMIYARRANAWGDKSRPTRQQALTLYTLRTGFDQLTGQPDLGTDTVVDMTAWATLGIRLDSQNLDVVHWATVDPSHDDHLAIAIGCLGPIAISMALPVAFQDLSLWASAPGDGPDWRAGSWGYHRVAIGKFDGRERVCRSWGQDLQIHPDSWSRYAVAVDATLSREWLEATGVAPSELDWAALEQTTALLA